ncbi:DUF4126 family protein [Granulicella sibirica]|uniref:DUF4126 domain-containing protein n=1 Tax=Granulicella sibirica TaxID=2479048 RepID=A0A4Q0T536_9BACT|nr:DUF4126 family protein [Granulicella sibirica]RXH58487.1 hypothetical protein GRAN_1797 [Granulicella sibirica]
MAMNLTTWLLAFPVLGFATGLRTMTPMAILCWFAYFKALPLDGTWGFWAANLISAIIFTVLAVGELIGDKLPRTPDRTDVVPLLARLFFGALVGGLAAVGAAGSQFEGILLSLIGAAAGTFVGFMFRRFFAHHHGNDLPVALGEDAIAILFALLSLRMIATT